MSGKVTGMTTADPLPLRLSMSCARIATIVACGAMIHHSYVLALPQLRQGQLNLIPVIAGLIAMGAVLIVVNAARAASIQRSRPIEELLQLTQAVMLVFALTGAAQIATAMLYV